MDWHESYVYYNQHVHSICQGPIITTSRALYKTQSQTDKTPHTMDISDGGGDTGATGLTCLGCLPLNYQWPPASGQHCPVSCTESCWNQAGTAWLSPTNLNQNCLWYSDLHDCCSGPAGVPLLSAPGFGQTSLGQQTSSELSAQSGWSPSLQQVMM